MLRTAIIGYGAVARSHLQDIRFFAPDSSLRSDDDPVVTLVAGCDISAPAREQFAADSGVNAVYSDCNEMLDRERPDFVHIATCADVRVEPVLACAERGVHVLCEKPMATEPAQCDRMIAACREAGVQLVISHQRRSDPLHWYARRLVSDGFIGNLRYITGTGKPRRGGNELHNIGTHLVDAAGIYGGPPGWVAACCTTDGRPSVAADREPGDRGAGWVLGERVDVWLGYQSGVQGRFAFSPDPAEFHWMLWGTAGRLALFGGDLWHCADPVPRPNSAWQLVDPPEETVTTDSGYVNPSDWKRLRHALGGYPRVFMMRELFWRMRQGGEHTSSGAVGAIPIEVMQAAFLSHLGGQRIDWPLRERTSPLSG